MLQSILTQLTNSITKFYPRGQTNAPFTANMSIGSKLPARVVIRLIWIRNNPGIQFDQTNLTHLYQVKDLYLAAYQDWTKDPLFANTS